MFNLTEAQKTTLNTRWDEQEAWAAPIVAARNGNTTYGLMNAFYSVATPEELTRMEAWKAEDDRLIAEWESGNLNEALAVESPTTFQWQVLVNNGYATVREDEGDDHRQGGLYYVRTSKQLPPALGDVPEEYMAQGF